MGKIEIKNEYINKLKKNLIKYYSEELGLDDIEKRINKRINRDRGKKHINKLSSFINLKDRKILDVGAGWGEFAFEARKKGAKIYGIEPDKELLKISNLLLGGKLISEGYAEKIQFKNNFFDIIICCYVLEHVNNWKQAIKEMMRVLKKNGYLYLCVPNYLFPYEGHYKIKWFPMMPKFLGRLYLKLIGRKPEFLNHINYTNSWSLLRELKKYNVEIKNISKEEVISSLKNNNFLKNLLMKFLIKFHLYPPDIILLIKKIGD